MRYTITHDPKTGIIHATAEGEWESHEEDAFLTEIFETVTATRARRLLGDISKLKHIDLSTLRLYEKALVLQSRRRELRLSTDRVAIVFDATDTTHLESFRFFETTARNRGLPYRMFEDRQEAIQWLSV